MGFMKATNEKLSYIVFTHAGADSPKGVAPSPLSPRQALVKFQVPRETSYLHSQKVREGPIRPQGFNLQAQGGNRFETFPCVSLRKICTFF